MTSRYRRVTRRPGQKSCGEVFLSVLGDVIMLALTRGLWLFWMAVRWVFRR